MDGDPRISSRDYGQPNMTIRRGRMAFACGCRPSFVGTYCAAMLGLTF